MSVIVRSTRFFSLAQAALLAAALVVAAPAGRPRADILDTVTNSITSGFGLFSGEKYKTELLPDIPAEDIYNQGLARLQSHDYEGAAKKFGELDKQFPFSQWARKGLLMAIFAQYQKPSYDDAVQSAQRYINLFPTSPDTPYVYYLAGMSFYNQVPMVMNDQDTAEKSLAIFTQLVEKFPKSEYVTDAKYKMQVVRDQLAAKEMLVGRFYLTRKNYPAAINRFHDVLGKYQSTRHAEEALYRLTEAYYAMGITNEAQTAAAVLGHNFPDSSWYKDAHALLKGGGLEPQEHQDSWLSKIGKKLGAG
ncbi:MAG: outer membrane protein assembly factor BamD [Methylocystis sp.]|nr:outer membrane protein assembly factor BamD [Methylocystis sp.]MBI3275362.1 outer membrane protein assembly factor BamD [Methylocystis sp.]